MTITMMMILSILDCLLQLVWEPRLEQDQLEDLAEVAMEEDLVEGLLLVVGARKTEDLRDQTNSRLNNNQKNNQNHHLRNSNHKRVDLKDKEVRKGNRVPKNQGVLKNQEVPEVREVQQVLEVLEAPEVQVGMTCHQEEEGQAVVMIMTVVTMMVRMVDFGDYA